MFKNILMPTDGSEHSERAIERGIELAKLCGAKVTGIHVVPVYRPPTSYVEGIYLGPENDDYMGQHQQNHAAHFLGFVEKSAKACGVPCETVIAVNDRPYDAIVNAANEHACDLIVMTLRYRRGLMSLLIGNESDRVLHRASIPVLTFRALMSADHPDQSAHQRWEVSHGNAKVDDSALGLPR